MAGRFSKILIAPVFAFGVLSMSIETTKATTELVEDLANRDYPLSLSGSYLAALSANRSRDLGAAVLYFDRALEADPENLVLIERSFLLRLAEGDVEGAAELADIVLKQDPRNRFGHMTLGVVALMEKSFTRALKEFKQVNQGPLARLTGTLLSAWTLAGNDQIDEALELLGKLEGPEWYHTFRHYHTGLIAELGGRLDIAEKHLKKSHEMDPNVIRTTEALARFQLRNGQEEAGRALLEDLIQRVANRPNIDAILETINKGEKPKRLIVKAQQGAMEVLHGLGSAIGREGGEEIAYVYLNFAAYLAPDNALPRLALGDLLEEDERYQKAIEHFQAIGDESPFKATAQMRLAFAYNAIDNLDKAKELMLEIIEREPDNLLAISSYGNVLRSHELYAEAREIYAKGIAKIDAKPEPQHWSLYYSRGISNERTKRWEEAEADFRKSLQLSPDQPQVLNYLGYSLIDFGFKEKYAEALDMIKKAVRLRPNDAFIIDSLGWAYFKLKDYETAVKHLERAVELRPQDPILNDHLGDAYWHVGRKLEAVFQWSHARDLDPMPEELEKIVNKIENGISDSEKDG